MLTGPWWGTSPMCGPQWTVNQQHRPWQGGQLLLQCKDWLHGRVLVLSIILTSVLNTSYILMVLPADVNAHCVHASLRMRRLQLPYAATSITNGQTGSWYSLAAATE